jgi:tRNA-dihydrouridine synthase A
VEREGGMIAVSVAPMMDRTDRHFRYFMRQITPHALLYTEMVTTGAVLHGDREHLLGFHPTEHPLALQLGGDDPSELARSAEVAQAMGYDEINLNVGCPSSRVQAGRFGASLMKEPPRVAAAVRAMRSAVDLPVTVKHRIGVDDLDRYEDMLAFVDTVAEVGCRRFTVHARKAWLQGLSPKENREVPPLRYEDVYQLKRDRPELLVEINGGVLSTAEVVHHLDHVDAVMIGRGAYDDPMWFAELDRQLLGGGPPRDRSEIAEAMIPYIEDCNRAGGPSHRVTRHMVNLYAGCVGARAWRRHLSEHGREPAAELIAGALKAVERASRQVSGDPREGVDHVEASAGR